MKCGKVKIISASLPADLADILGDISSSQGIPRSRLITQAVETFVRYKYPQLWHLLEVTRNA